MFEKVVFLLDRSISMEYGNKIAELSEAVINFIKKYNSREVGIITFDHLTEELLPLGTLDNLENLKNVLKNVLPRGNTNISKVISFANEKYSSVDFVLISDGRVNMSMGGSGSEGEENVMNEVKEIAKKLSERGNSLSSIAVGEDSFISFLKEISSFGNGAFYISKDLLELEDFKIKGSYKLTVHPLPEELPAGKPTWAKELNSPHVAVASNELFNIYKNSKLTIAKNNKTNSVVAIPLVSIEIEELSSFRERLPKRTEQVRKSKSLLVDVPTRRALRLNVGEEANIEFLEL